jgi:hypothetical protein
MQKIIEERSITGKAACESKSEGDACMMENRIGYINGTCIMQDTNLTCRPEIMPERGPK